MQERRAGITKAPKRKNIGDDFALRGFVCCADCGVPLRSSWSTGNTKRYAYYLCQTKTCDSYGKSIPRDKLEGEVGGLIKALDPTQQLFTLAKAMFRRAWDQRLSQAQEAVLTVQRQIKEIEKQVETLLSRIMDSSNSTVIGTYEEKITTLEKKKIILTEQLANQAEPKGTYEEKLEPALTFLASPWKLWETGHTALQRLVLKLAFAERIQYDRNQGPRTPQSALPFKVLGKITDQRVCFGAGEGT